MTGRDIICLAPTEWSGAWQRYHEIMLRFANAGNSVLVIDNLFRRIPPVPSSLPMFESMARKAWQILRDLQISPRPVAPRLSTLSLPIPPSGGSTRLTWSLLRAVLHRAGYARRGRPPILWVGFPTPLISHFIEDLRPQVVVYDCADPFRKDPAIDAQVLATENWLLQRADVVLTSSEKMWEEYSSISRRCHWIPNGVNYAQFADEGLSQTRSDPRPVVGYIGTLHRWLDIALITAVVEEHPGWIFAFAGPRRIRADVGRLEQLSNVQFLGPHPHDALPALLHQFDVAWIPYQVVEFTHYVFPAKLMEYLAAGRPVVSTDLPEVRPFAPPVRIGMTAHEIGEHIAAALRSPPDGRGRELARRFDWALLIDEVHHYLDNLLVA